MSRTRRIEWVAIARLAFAVAIVSVPRVASANGRFPRSLELQEDPQNPDHLYLAGTYGLLRTTDRGKSWYFVCEQSFADNALYVGDPLLAFSGAGSILVDVQVSLNFSRDDGCGWAPTLGGGTLRVTDFAVAKSTGSTVVAVVSDYQARVVHHLEESTDAGRTWASIGSALPVETVTTIDLDPANTAHIMATGLDNQQGLFLDSIDHGNTWTTYPIPNTDSDHVPYLAAIHPTNSQRIFVRTDGTLRDQVPLASDSLFYSNDGGKTWSEPIGNGAKMLGFALSPDGGTVLLGYGDPGSGAMVTGGIGIYRSNTDTFSFSRIWEANVSCLTWTPAGVYACAAQGSSAKADLLFLPATQVLIDALDWTRLLQLEDVQGPVTCGVGSIDCARAWEATCPTFEACRDCGSPADGGSTCGADATAPDARLPIEGGEVDERHEDHASLPDADLADAAPDEDLGKPAGTFTTSSAACSCQEAGGATAAPLPTFALGALALLGWRRRAARATKERIRYDARRSLPNGSPVIDSVWNHVTRDPPSHPHRRRPCKVRPEERSGGVRAAPIADRSRFK
jgi:photosystem II stability/assembly factor-like uncharacterized protein